MESVDTNVVSSARYRASTKGWVGPGAVVKDFLPLVHHMHLKDYVGGREYLGTARSGRARSIFRRSSRMMEGRKRRAWSWSNSIAPPQPAPAIENAQNAKPT